MGVLEALEAVRVSRQKAEDSNPSLHDCLLPPPLEQPAPHRTTSPLQAHQQPTPQRGYRNREPGGCDSEGEGRLTGKIKSFDIKTGYGFISCQQVQTTHGCDVFFHHGQVYDAFPLDQVQAGLSVSFYCKITDNGKPQGRVLRIDKTTPAAASPSPSGSSGSDHSEASVELETYVGSIKSFSEEKGYGFIACKQTHDRFKRDVFLHHSKLAGFKVMDRVKFSISMKQDQPQVASALRPLVSEQTLATPASEAAESEAAPAEKPAATPTAKEKPSHVSRWQAFESDDDRGVWWWNEADDDWFLESDPGEWVKYVDPATEKAYWWNPDGKMFWA